MTISTTEQNANYAKADALLKRWSNAVWLLDQAREAFTELVTEYEALKPHINVEETDEFDERVEAMKAIDLAGLEELYYEVRDIQFPLDIDNRFPEVDWLATPSKRTRKRKGSAVAASAA